ncbi:CRAL/TRIO domain-containing protein, partial [Ceraceosorus guamensis]
QPRPGHPGSLSVSQSAALKTFEQELGRLDALPIGYEADATEEEKLWAQVTLTRYLRARSWNVNNALTMYNATQKWRTSQRLGDLVDPSSSSYFTFDERDAVAEAGWSMYFHNTDKLGRPIFVQGLAGLDTVKLLKATTPERIQTNFCCTLEKACQTRYRAATQARRSLGDTTALIDDNFMIVDIGGLGMSTFWAFKGQLQGLLATLDANFPELSGRVQIINAPWLFSSIWAYIKGWLPVGTVDKIDIQGADYKSTLLQYIDADQLPAFYGGACRCSEGCQKSDVGPW